MHPHIQCVDLNKRTNIYIYVFFIIFFFSFLNKVIEIKRQLHNPLVSLCYLPPLCVSVSMTLIAVIPKKSF